MTQNPEKTIRVLIVDDHPLIREGAASLIDPQPDMEVCGQAETADEALAMMAAAKPDVVVTDISLPGKSGIELIKELAVSHPEVATIAVSMHEESVYAERVLRAGARGYVMKKEGGAEMIEAIRKVRGGEIAVSGKMSAQILRNYCVEPGSEPEAPERQLSDREFAVFELFGRGLSTAEVGIELGISPKTVEVHRSHIKEKLKIRSNPQLIAYAVRWTESAGGK